MVVAFFLGIGVGVLGVLCVIYREVVKTYERIEG